MARERGGSSVVSLLTDFGTADGYVAAMKGVILRIAREARIVDITHEVRPQDVWEGAFVLHTAHSYFPAGTVHVAVVDPGVGTDRAGIILDTGNALFVAPDNGLLSFILEEARRGLVDSSLPTIEDTAPSVGAGLRPAPTGEARPRTPANPYLPAGWRAVRIEEPRFWLPEPSSTFHGRDIFAPVAAHLSLGEPLHSFGPPVDRLTALSVPRPESAKGGRVRGIVLHVDRFGNLITNLRLADLPREPFAVDAGAGRTARYVRTYADERGLIALLGSSGYMEIALPGGSAHADLGAGAGAEVWAFPLDPAHS